MKVLFPILTTTVLLNMTAQASEAVHLGTVICHQIQGRHSTPLPATALISEVGKNKYTLEIFRTGRFKNKLNILKSPVNAWGEDVQVFFTGPGHSFLFKLFLDEGPAYFKSDTLNLEMQFNCKPLV